MWKYIFGILMLSIVALGFFVITYPDDNLHVIACDVGQGDAFLVTYKKTQILIDGGPGKAVTNCLDRHVPFWDRTIEVVMNTHPQLDHYGGLIEVLERYNVQIFTANSLNAGAQEYRLLEVLVGREGAKVLFPEAGMKFLYDQVSLEMLHPTKEWLAENTEPPTAESNTQVLGKYTSTVDPNAFSIIAILHFKNFDALFTGDTFGEITDILKEQSKLSDIEYLKVPHHGSKNGLTKELLDATTPEIAVISNGKRNNYGHPHKEVLDMLTESHSRVLRTDQLGDVEVVSDGERYWIK